MLYVRDKVAKLGNVILGGEVTSVEIEEVSTIYVATDEKGKQKKSQPVGYENGKVYIDILLEDMNGYSTLQQLGDMQNLFKPYGQDKPKLIPIVNEDCAARGITQVYFKSLTSKKVIAESKRVASLELWAPNIGKVKIVKKKKSVKITQVQKKSKSKKITSKSPAKDSRDTSKGKKTARKITKKIRG